ncbi:MAG: glycosyltransferase [Nitrososphaera sp.]
MCTDKNVLEIHCGDGYGTSILAKKSLHIDGIDHNSDKIRFALRNFFILNKTRFVIADSFDYLGRCNNYEITVIFDAEEILNENNKFDELLDLIPSPTAIMVFSNQLKINRQYDELLKQKEITCEKYYEHGNTINQINDDSRNLILVLKNIKNRLTRDNEKQKVSIVIPAYNSESTLEETITSALDQSYSNIEVIVVDDGSTDKTKKICEKFSDKIKYYYKQNGGISSALNFGIKKMSGEWFKWLSSDDLLTRDAVEKLMQVHYITGGQIIYSDYDIIDEKSKFVRVFKEPVYHSYYEFASKIWIRYIGNASSVLIHKSCFDIVGPFDESLRFGEDYEWWQRACLVYGYRFFHLQEAIAKYRIHPKQLTVKIGNKTFENDQTIRKHTKNLILGTDPDWWKTLTAYQRNYNKTSLKTKMKRIMRNTLRHMPTHIERMIIDWRIRTIK